MLMWSYRVLAEYLLDDQATYPKPSAAPVSATFTPTASNSSIVQAASQFMNSRV